MCSDLKLVGFVVHCPVLNQKFLNSLSHMELVSSEHKCLSPNSFSPSQLLISPWPHQSINPLSSKFFFPGYLFVLFNLATFSSGKFFLFLIFIFVINFLFSWPSNGVVFILIYIYKVCQRHGTRFNPSIVILIKCSLIFFRSFLYNLVYVN